MQSPISLVAACRALPELWSPRVLGRINDLYLKAVRVQGTFPWHSHAAEDELFLVLQGELHIGRAEADGGEIVVRPGECFIVPRGVRHNTSASEETLLLLLEPVTTKHTGDEMTAMTRSLEEQLA